MNVCAATVSSQSRMRKFMLLHAQHFGIYIVNDVAMHYNIEKGWYIWHENHLHVDNHNRRLHCSLVAAEANVPTHVSACEICGEIWQWTKFSSTNFGLPVNKIPPPPLSLSLSLSHTHTQTHRERERVRERVKCCVSCSFSCACGDVSCTYLVKGKISYILYFFHKDNILQKSTVSSASMCSLPYPTMVIYYCFLQATTSNHDQKRTCCNKNKVWPSSFNFSY